MRSCVSARPQAGSRARSPTRQHEQKIKDSNHTIAIGVAGTFGRARSPLCNDQQEVFHADDAIAIKITGYGCLEAIVQTAKSESLGLIAVTDRSGRRQRPSERRVLATVQFD